jgi:FSR family fosmidomycin resistance protein-like MFS transporter
VLYLPLAGAIVVLPLLGVVLNGVTTVIYGSVPEYSAPDQKTRALSIFYTISIGAAAVAPPVSGLIGDHIGIHSTIIVVSLLTLATIPLAFGLRGGRSQAAAV